jgi:hypothetical protein
MPGQFLVPLGRLLMIGTNIWCCIGAFLFDFNETHIFNPRWPPHAKFHDGQTLRLAVLLAALSSFLVYQSVGMDPLEAKNNLRWAAVLGSFYCGAGLSAIFYPGTAWVDPEYKRKGQVTQLEIFSVMLGVMWLGCVLATWS